MAHKSEHIQSDRIFVERLEVFADWKRRAAVLADDDGGNSLRDLRRGRRIGFEPAIGVIVRIDETRRDNQAAPLDDLGPGGHFNLATLARGGDRIAFQYD